MTKEKDTIIVISGSEYDRLVSNDYRMTIMEGFGVDNWDGYIGSTFYCETCEKDYHWDECEVVDFQRYSCDVCGEVS